MTQTIPPPRDDDPTSVRPPAPPGPPPGEPEAARRFGWGLALGALVLIAVAAAAAAAYFATRGGSSSTTTTVPATTTAPTTTGALVPAGRVIVPDVTGLQEEQAAARLGAAHLSPKVKTKATPKPTGIVVSQTPPSGKQAKKGGTVTIVVDAGAPAVAVPDLTGLNVAAAGKRLADAKLKAQTTQVTAAKPAGTVVSQAPAAGTKLKQGSVVTLSVAHGSPAAGTTTTAATTTAAAPTTTAAQTTTSAPPAHPSTATVPDVTNGALADAADALAQAGPFPNVAYVPGTEPLGTVLEQAKQAGTTTPWGGYVRVNVSKGPQPPANATVPDLSGRPRADAMQALSSAGFEVKVLWKQAAPGAKNDVVLDEQPSRGTQAPRGALVILIVSRR
ncbi:MAG: PASTA domain-containing protein [Gaiellaceae bacterium]